MINILIIILLLILFFFMNIKKEPFINDALLDLNYIKELTKNISIYRPAQSENLKNMLLPN